MAVCASDVRADETQGPDHIVPAFLPMPVPELMATAASPDPVAAAQALSRLLAMGPTTDWAMLRLLSAGTTQDARIALHVAERPDAAAIPALLRALERFDDDTDDGHSIAKALRACVPHEFGPPTMFVDVDGRRREDPRAWRDWGRRHRNRETTACLGRSALSAFPLVMMVLGTRGQRRA